VVDGAPAQVTSVDDPRVAVFRSLRGRESNDVLWAEGPTVVERLFRSPVAVRAVLLTPAALARVGVRLPLDRAEVLVAEQALVNEIVGFDLHRGIIAAAERPALRSVGQVIGAAARRLVVLEGINDFENLGAIARSARALGADGLLLDPTCADPYYRRAVRVSMGEMLHLPVARAPMPELLAALDAAGFETWALTPRRDATPIDELVRLRVPDRVAVLLGAEGPGLSDAVLTGRRNVRIRQRDDVDSLNVGHATAAALALLSGVASSAP
jgi:tRNA G18 (ribose-2'-O)-methylase SpoU